MTSTIEAIRGVIFRQIAPTLRDTMLEVSSEQLFNEFQVAVRRNSIERGNSEFHLDEAPTYKQVVGRLKQSDNTAERMAGYALELRRRKDGKTFKLTQKQHHAISTAIKRRLHAR